MQRIILLVLLLLIASFNGCDGKAAYRLMTDYARLRSGMTTHYQSIGGHLTVAYFENNVSTRPTLVLLHGFEAQKEHWLPLAHALHDRYHLVIPDLIGDGESSKPMEVNYSIGAQARRLHRFILKRKLEHIVLVGNSMGGAIAVWYAAHFPVDKLILIDPLGMEKERSALEKMGEARFRKVFLDICQAQDIQRLMRTVFHNPPYIPGVILDYMAREKCRFSDLDKRKASYLYHQGHWVFEKTLPESARRITVQTLILWGRDDAVLSFRNAHAFQEAIPHSHLIIIPGAGHVPMIEKPKQTARYFRDFID